MLMSTWSPDGLKRSKREEASKLLASTCDDLVSIDNSRSRPPLLYHHIMLFARQLLRALPKLTPTAPAARSFSASALRRSYEDTLKNLLIKADSKVICQ